MTQRDKVLQTYRIEVAVRGQRGAYARTGREHGISDETVRRWVRDAEQETDDLAYVGPPNGYPTPHPANPVNNITTELPFELPHDTTDAIDEPEPHAQEDATPLATIATFERRVATQRLDPGWEMWWITCAQDHMPALQLVVGVVVAWLLISVVY